MKTEEKYINSEIENSPSSGIDHQNSSNNDELVIDLKEIYLFIKRHLKKVFITTGIFFVLGIAVALLTPEEYTASTKLLPETGSMGGSNNAAGFLKNFGLGGMFQDNNNVGVLSVSMYPQIIQSTPFLHNMINEKVYFAVDQGANTDRYQGIVELKGASLVDCVQHYFKQFPFLYLLNIRHIYIFHFNFLNFKIIKSKYIIILEM